MRSLLEKLDGHTREVLTGAMTAFVIRILGTAFGFLFNLMLARLLGAQGAGVYFLAFTLAMIASVLGRLGLDNAVLRYVAAGVSRGRWEQVAGVSRQGVLLALGASALAAVALYILSEPLALHVFAEPALVEALQLMAFSVVPFSLLTLYAEMLKGLKRTGEASAIQSLAVPLFSITALLGMAAVAAAGVRHAAAAYVAATAVTLFMAVWLWRRATPRLRGVQGAFDRRQLIDTSLPLLWVSAMAFVLTWTDTLLIGVFLQSEAVGLYSVAARVALLTSFVLVAVNAIAAPKFAALYEAREMHALGRLARRSALLMTLAASPLLVVLLVWPEWVLWLFGDEFTQASSALRLLAVGQFVNVLTGSVGYLLMMTGHERLMRNTVIVAALLNILLNVTLIPLWGIDGAALATALSVSAMNLLAAWYVFARLSIVTLPFLRQGDTV